MPDHPARPIQLNFDNLPLVEAAVRATIQPPIELSFSLIGRVQKRINDAYPDVAEPVVIESPPGVREFGFEMRPGKINGAIFRGNPLGLMSTLQGNLVATRWVKQFTDASPEYPRFESLQSTHWKVVDALRNELASSSIPIIAVNMSYANFVQGVDQAAVLREYFSELVQVKATDDAEELQKIECAWREKAGIDLRFALDRVEARIGDERMSGYQLTTVAGVMVQENALPEAALECVHLRLQQFFLDILSNRAKEEWELRKESQ